jgi:molybdopterin synthase sulfur carrier subunit
MATVQFTKALQRHVSCPPDVVAGATVHDALHAYFALHPAVRGYVLDEQGKLRKHVTVFVDGAQLVDRGGMSDPLRDDAQIHVMQALSGG